MTRRCEQRITRACKCNRDTALLTALPAPTRWLAALQACGSLAEVAELLGDSKLVAADHYGYTLTDYREVDRTIALGRVRRWFYPAGMARGCPRNSEPLSSRPRDGDQEKGEEDGHPDDEHAQSPDPVVRRPHRDHDRDPTRLSIIQTG